MPLYKIICTVQRPVFTEAETISHANNHPGMNPGMFTEEGETLIGWQAPELVSGKEPGQGTEIKTEQTA